MFNQHNPRSLRRIYQKQDNKKAIKIYGIKQNRNAISFSQPKIIRENMISFKDLVGNFNRFKQN